jgi:putative ABC transport system permease protein
VQLVAPLAFGTAPMQFGNRVRECPILGSTQEMLAIRHLEIAQGRFLEDVDPHRGAGVCVVGAAVKDELFGARPALGEIVRIGDRRFRLVGVLQPLGQSLGLDIDDCVLVPVADALALFNSPSLFRILVQARDRQSIEACERDVERILAERHGEHDVTVITQDAVMGTFDRIFVVLTLTVAGIAAISLVVAGILIMNVMVISVAQRRSEVGLLMALGARRRDVGAAFLAESALLSGLGALAGIGVGQAVTRLAGGVYPALQSPVPAYAVAAAAGTALLTGLLFGVLPAQRAARLDPVLALSRR